VPALAQTIDNSVSIVIVAFGSILPRKPSVTPG
jgi:hypothetical protein